MSAKSTSAKDSAPKVPGYIVTYSDMVTLLLTFFVMLLSLADQQDPELVSSGRDAFVQSMKGLGLGMLFGKQQRFSEGEIKIRYPVAEPEEPTEEILLDAKEEELKRLFNQIKNSMITKPSQLVANRVIFPIINIKFKPGQATLDDPAKASLLKLCRDLQTAAGPDERKLYVVGIANEKISPQEKWILSSKRAKTVADFIKNTIPSSLNWPIYSWGAGSGGQWNDKDSIASSDQQVLLAVLETVE